MLRSPLSSLFLPFSLLSCLVRRKQLRRERITFNRCQKLKAYSRCQNNVTATNHFGMDKKIIFVELTENVDVYYISRLQ